MRIIEHGPVPEEIKYTKRCFCKTLFEFTRREGRVIYDYRDGDYITIACPVCRRENTIAL